jgi:hypothetical protein
MRRLVWGLAFVVVVMLSNPGVDVPLSHTPTLALVMGSLALLASWLVTIGRPTPAFNVKTDRSANTAHRRHKAAAARSRIQALSV